MSGEQQFEKRWMEVKWLRSQWPSAGACSCSVCGHALRIWVWGNPFRYRKRSKQDYHVIGACPRCKAAPHKIGTFSESGIGMYLGPPVEKIKWKEDESKEVKKCQEMDL